MGARIQESIKMAKHLVEVDPSISERLVSLELQVAAIRNQQVEESKDLKEVLKEMGRYKGFIGGILFMGSCVWAFFKFCFPYIVKH
jgi:hypothetical protein